MLDTVSIQLLGRLRRQAMNPALQSRYDGRDGTLGPGESVKTLNTTHPECAHKDGILRSSEGGS